MSGSSDRLFKSGLQLARFPSCARGDRSKLISVSDFGRLVSTCRQQFADDGERVHLNDFGPEFAPQARKELEAEEHPDFVGVRKSCRRCRHASDDPRTSRVCISQLGSGGSAKGGQPATPEFIFRCSGALCRRCGRSVERDPPYIPVYLASQSTAQHRACSRKGFASARGLGMISGASFKLGEKTQTGSGLSIAHVTSMPMNIGVNHCS